MKTLIATFLWNLGFDTVWIQRNAKLFLQAGKEVSWEQLYNKQHDYPYYFKNGVDIYPRHVKDLGVVEFKVGDTVDVLFDILKAPECKYADYSVLTAQQWRKCRIMPSKKGDHEFIRVCEYLSDGSLAEGTVTVPKDRIRLRPTND